ncbi:glycosyl hydrolase family 95 catalytic domain-containing protein [Paenibacillus massiliensis]|uniref:glycosyl hydrolase family 95 catalytic domain-containing protein n=1 Tax=Paenibacillus massiliensis TaxID=225917 RepID=UPI00037CBE2B|nr:glycoside hydrolase N-terminal domain-containing protein [Paenibacillus massiliensis]
MRFEHKQIQRSKRAEQVEHRGQLQNAVQTEANRGNQEHSIRPDKNRLRLRYPASWWKGMWREALPSGNGILGASVQGGIQEETVLLQHSDLWHWGRKEKLPDVSHTLPETRKLMDEGRYQEASWHLTQVLQEKGYASKLASRCPLALLSVSMSCENAFRQYRRELDMDTGEVQVRWQDGKRCYSRTLFVSRADDCVVYKLDHWALEKKDNVRTVEKEEQLQAQGQPAVQPTVQAAGQAAGQAWLKGSIGLGFPPGDRARDDEEFETLKASVTVREDGDYLLYSARNDNGQDFGAVLRLIRIEADGIEASNMDYTTENSLEQAQSKLEQIRRADGLEPHLQGRLHFRTSGKLLVLIKMFVTGEREREWLRLKQELGALDTDYATLLSRHTELHQALFHSAKLELDDVADDERCNEEMLLEAYEGEAPAGLVRKQWAYGRYLFISGVSEHGSLPFGLYGLWGGDYRLIWGHHMANENVQMMYWHTHVGGLTRLNQSLFRYYNGLLEDFRDNARKLYGCKGIYVPAGTTPGQGAPNQIVPVIMNWTGAAGWLARHYYEHFQYTRDMDFLLEQALPFMKEALLFYEDFLVLDAGGQYVIYPSVSPENTPDNFMPKDGKPLAHPMPTAINATMDVAIIKELLQNVIEACRIVCVDLGEIPKWEAMLERLPPYTLNEEGAVKEWLHPDFDDRQHHRHLSHLYPVFPGQEICREEQPELFQAFEAAVHQRQLGAQSGWSLAHMSSIYARLGDGEKALECLDVLARSCLLSNGYTLHNDWRNMGVCMSMPAAPVQLDANLGWVNAVQEMLLYASSRWIKLLPALPERWCRGTITDWRIPGGSLSITWDRSSGWLQGELIAIRQITTKLQLPDWGSACILYCRKAGSQEAFVYDCLETEWGHTRTINLESGDTLVFEPDPSLQ